MSQASRVAYFGQNPGDPTNDGVDSQGRPNQGRQAKRNTASVGTNKRETKQKEENLNLCSPQYKGYSSKSAKNKSKTNRKKEVISTKQSKANSGQPKQTMHKKIKELGSVYDSKSMVLPGMNGSVVRASAQELTQMRGGNHHLNGQSRQQQTRTIQRKGDDFANKRIVSQSPQFAYKDQDEQCKANQINSHHHQTEGQQMVSKRDLNLKQSHISQDYRQNTQQFDYEENLMILSDKNQAYKKRHESLSAISDRNSLPDISSRKQQNQSVKEEVDQDEEGDNSLKNKQQSRESIIASSTVLKSSPRKQVSLEIAAQTLNLHEITISEDNIALASFTQTEEMGDFLKQTTIEAANAHLKNYNKTNEIINLPRIAKQAVESSKTKPQLGLKAGQNNLNKKITPQAMRNQNKNIGTTKLKPNQQHYTPLRSQSNNPQSIARVNSQANQFSPRSPNFSQAKNLNREMTRGKLLEPLKIVELPDTEQSTLDPVNSDLIAQTQAEQQSKDRFDSDKFNHEQPMSNASTLKPLNHTPNICKAQKQLVTASKTFNEKDGGLKPYGFSTAKKPSDQKRGTGTFGKRNASLVSRHDKTPERPKTNNCEDGDLASIETGNLEDENTKSHAPKRDRKDKSPMRGASNDKASYMNQIAGARLQKDLRDTAIVAQSQNAEPFYRRAVKKLGWREAPQNDQIKTGFHIRFNISDFEGSSKGLQPHHFYNHFPQNRELVTKMGLCKNLWFNCFSEQENHISNLFPRCYDLSVTQQAETFINDFKETAILSIIKIMATDFVSQNAEIQNLLDEYERCKDYQDPERFFKPFFKKKCLDLDQKSTHNGNLLGISEVQDAYTYAKNLCNTLQFKEAKKTRKYMRASKQRLSDAQIQEMVEFQNKLIEQGIPDSGFDAYSKFKICRLHMNLQRLLPQYRQIDGTHNIWIVKPSYNARGHGIYCTRQLREILKASEKTQQKVVQKYIERPLCVEGQKKFDFRQWVLVNSWEPLDVCVFQSAYLKVCGSTFDLKNISDVYRHLSNYSIQKENGEKEELVMSTPQFEQFMQQSKAGKPDFKWETDMLPQINDVVWRTLKSVQENIEQKHNCFEVYGFDIVLDEDLQPWVIEVNLSPACNERTPWLKQMLNDSCTDLLRHIQSRILTASPAEQWSSEMVTLREQATSNPHKTTKFLNPEPFYEEFQIQDRWIRLPESIAEIKEFQKTANLALAPQKGLQLELVGEKQFQKYERKLDKGYKNDESAREIQRLFRGHKGRLIFRAALREKCAIIIQKNTRSLLAKCELIRLRQKRASTIIQKQLRRILAQKLAKKMDEERILNLKTALVTKLQTRYRMQKAKTFVHSVRQEQASQRCQRYVRGYLARVKAKQERTKLCLIVRIQRFFKQRFRYMQKSAKIVQKQLKRRIVQKKTKKLREITKASTNLRVLIHKNQTNSAYRHLKQNSKAIKLQSWFRMTTSRLKYKAVLKSLAHQKVRKLMRIHFLKGLKNFAKILQTLRDKHATTIQNQLRGRLASKKLQKMRKEDMLNRNAILVQRYIMGYLGKKEARRQRIKIGAAIMIQALARGFLVRLDLKRQIQQEQLRQDQRRADRQKSKRNDGHNNKFQPVRDIRKTESVQQYANMQGKGHVSENRQQEERGKRYQSNPNKFISKPKQAHALASNASQGSINKSHSSLMKLTTDQANYISSQLQSSNNGNKKRKVNRKVQKSSAMKEKHMELGLKHLHMMKQDVDPRFQKTQNQSASNKRAIHNSQEPRNHLLKMHQVSEPQARLGQKIASNLQNQRVENLINDPNNAAPNIRGHVPTKQKSALSHHAVGHKTQYDERLDKKILETFTESDNSQIRAANSFHNNGHKVPPIDLRVTNAQNNCTIDTRNKSDLTKHSLQSNSQIMTPVMKNKKLNLGNQDQQLTKDSSQQKLVLTKQRGGTHANVTTNLPAVCSSTRRSFNQDTTHIQSQVVDKIVARGLGKDSNVVALATSIDKNIKGQGQAQTVVMKKDSSKGSLHSGRQSQRREQNNQYKQHIAFSQKMDKAKLGQNMMQMTKDQSKQIKNLEKLVQHGSAYMHPQAKPQIFNKSSNAASLREKIAEQQRQLADGTLHSNSKTSSLKPGEKSFAKYLNEMLESQNTMGLISSTEQSLTISKENNFFDQERTIMNKKSSAFSSQGKNSISGIRVHQPEFKPILATKEVASPKMTASKAVISLTTVTEDHNIPYVNKDGSRSILQLDNSRNGPNLSQLTNTVESSAVSKYSPSKKVDGSVQNLLSHRETSEEQMIIAQSSKQKSGIRGGKISIFSQQAEQMNNNHQRKTQDSVADHRQHQPMNIGIKKGGASKSYQQTATAFTKTTDGYLKQMKREHDRRYEQVNQVHKVSQSLLNNNPSNVASQKAMNSANNFCQSNDQMELPQVNASHGRVGSGPTSRGGNHSQNNYSSKRSVGGSKKRGTNNAANMVFI